MANLDEQLWQACYDEDWTQAAFLLEAGAGTEWRDEHENTAILWAAVGMEALRRSRSCSTEGPTFMLEAITE
jgi:hypothetical protein